MQKDGCTMGLRAEAVADRQAIVNLENLATPWQISGNRDECFRKEEVKEVEAVVATIHGG